MTFFIQNKGKDLLLNAIGAVALKAALYSTGGPGSLGTTNEISGGSPAYARQAITWTNSTGGGPITLVGTAIFNVPGGGTSVKYIGLWNNGGTVFYGYWDITVATFSQQGTLTITSGTLDM